MFIAVSIIISVIWVDNGMAFVDMNDMPSSEKWEESNILYSESTLFFYCNVRCSGLWEGNLISDSVKKSIENFNDGLILTNMKN